jgi:Cytochrome domain of cellobiose dehydrogenase
LTASSGSGDIFFQIKAPSPLKWAAVAQGTAMKNAQFFVIYSNEAGDNVTLSPRSKANEVMPQYNSNAKVELLEGSGIENGVMTANIRCKYTHITGYLFQSPQA